MNNDLTQSKIVLYSTDDGNVSVEVLFHNETFWLTQKAMAELFAVESHTITYHLQEIYKTEELEEFATTRKIRAVRKEGARYVERELQFYSLDAIIAVGYRVNSKSATRFRRWATETLKQFIIKGFVLNDDMLKNGRPFGKDYFDELLERIREIRASERRFYQKITDIYALSHDYRVDCELTQAFFATVQNKLLFAITGKTAPELIANRADSAKPHMGLTTWKAAPKGKILQTDVTISKNYLSQDELSGLNRIVNMYLDYAENQALRNIPMAMADWATRLDAFLQFNEYELLHHKGTVEKKVADALAKEEFKKFRVLQDAAYVSDFDKVTSKLLEKGRLRR